MRPCDHEIIAVRGETPFFRPVQPWADRWSAGGWRASTVRLIAFSFSIFNFFFWVSAPTPTRTGIWRGDRGSPAAVPSLQVWLPAM